MKSTIKVVVAAFSLIAAGTAAAETAGEYVDDSTLQARVKTELMSDDFAGGAGINLETRKGVVQLGGFVDDAAKAEQAEKVVAAVDGVAKVDNQLHEKPGKRTTGQSLDDKVITTRVKSSLADADFGTGMDINVDTYNGVVLLTGFVKSKETAKLAAKLAEGVDNVDDVINGVYVSD